jgi:two-component system alkaline phosphatase synthesis response regulator PhoP
MQSILIIDDEDDIREILSYNLKKEGFKVHAAENGIEGLKKAKKFLPDLILLDVMMPEMDGIEVCEQLVAYNFNKKPIICFLTARSEDYSQIAGLDAGADDYVTKPIKPKVLVSKINALLRRSSDATSLNQGENTVLKIDRERYVIVLNDQEIQLPRKEFELLYLLHSEPGKVFERDIILNSVWGTEIIVGDRTIDVHIRKLREKIGNEMIKTVKGIGYKFVE